MKKVLYRLPRTVVDEDTGRRIRMNGLEKYFVKTKHFDGKGFRLTEEELQSKGIYRKGKDTFAILDPNEQDMFSDLKRGPQLITEKDIGYVAAKTRITRGTTVLDAGAGSGAATTYLARIADKVVSCDVDQRSLAVTEENIRRVDVDNVELREQSVYDAEGFEENTFDVFLCDVPFPWEAINTAHKTVRLGGFFVVYAPQISQVQRVFKELPEGLLHVSTEELIQREWNVGEKLLRPSSKGVGHTGFLMFLRKIGAF